MNMPTMKLPVVHGSVSLTPWDWNVDAAVLIPLALIIAGLALALRWEARHRDPALHAPLSHSIWWCVGAVVSMYVASQSPLEVAAMTYSLSAHMLLHSIFADISAPCLMFAVRKTAIADALGRMAWVRLAETLLCNMWSAVFLVSAIFIVWTLPGPYDLALYDSPMMFLQHVTYFVAGAVMWWPIMRPLDPDAWEQRSDGRILALIGYITFTCLPFTILGFIITMTPHVLYTYYVGRPLLWGISHLADQQWAGMIMLGWSNCAGFLVCTLLFFRLGADRAGENPHEAVPAEAVT